MAAAPLVVAAVQGVTVLLAGVAATSAIVATGKLV